MTPIKYAIGAVFALFVFGLFGGSFYTVDPGERAVVVRFGSIVGSTEPGLHFKMPYVDTVRTVTTQTHVMRVEKVQAYSKDQQPADLRVSINWEIPDARVGEVISDYGNEKNLLARLVEPRILAETKVVFGQYTAVTAIQDRGKLTADALDLLQKSITGPVRVTSLQFENIDFSDAYEKSVEARMLAEVEVQKLRQNADREKVQAEIVVTQAKAKADAVRAEAQANADAVKLRGEAEASAIRARGAALKDNPSLVALTTAERWDGKLPTTMVPAGSVPFVEVAK